VSGERGGELFPLDRALRGIRERFADAVIDAERTSLREHTVVVPGERLAEVAGAVANEWGGALLTFFALDERDSHGRFRLHALFSMAPEDAVLTLVSALPGHAPAYAPLATRVPAARELEREVRERMGVSPVAGSDPRFALAPGRGLTSVSGPLQAGFAESRLERVASDGVIVRTLETQLGWAARGLEALATGASVTRGLALAERLCGTCAFAHALAFCQAAEELAGVVVPPRARALRSFAAELERLASHLADLGGFLAAAGVAAAAAEFARLEQVVRRVNGQLFGHRFLRGVCVPGGVQRDVGDAHQLWLRGVLGDLRADARRALRALDAGSLAGRLAGAGVLEAAVAREVGVTGVAARASGLLLDGRRDHPYAFYRDLDFQVVHRERGDARARIELRGGEIHESLNLVDQMILRLPGGPLAQHLGELPPSRWGVGVVESPRGLHVHWLRADARGAIADWRVRSASHAIWPAFGRAAEGAALTDLPLVRASFAPCVACADR